MSLAIVRSDLKQALTEAERFPVPAQIVALINDALVHLDYIETQLVGVHCPCQYCSES